MVAAERRHGRTSVDCIVVSVREDESTVTKWLTVAARVPGFIGFAVGHTDFSEALLSWRDKTMTREEEGGWAAALDPPIVGMFVGGEAAAGLRWGGGRTPRAL